MILLILFGLMVVGVALMWFGISEERGKEPEVEHGGMVVTGIVAFICSAMALLIIGTAVPLNNMSKIAYLESFYEVNAQNYAVATQKTTDLLTVNLDSFTAPLLPIEGSIEKWEQGKYISERIAEWRDEVNRYNGLLQNIRVYDRNLMLGVLYPTLSPDLKFIVIE